MAKNASSKKEEAIQLEKLDLQAGAPEAAAPSKLAGMRHRAFGVFKLLLGIALLPLVYAQTVAFLEQFWRIDPRFQEIFWEGIITFLVVYLFIWEPAGIYRKGHHLLELFFGFLKPMVKVAPFLLPMYTIILTLLYLALSLKYKSESLLNYFVFLFGFSWLLHLVFSAKTVRGKEGDFVKGNYVFMFSFIYIVNISLLAILFNLLFVEFSLVGFFNNSLQITKQIFSSTFTQLFSA